MVGSAGDSSHAWVQVFRHVPEIQVFHDKQRNVLLFKLNSKMVKNPCFQVFQEI